MERNKTIGFLKKFYDEAEWRYVEIILIRIAVLTLFYSVIRVIFLAFNWEAFRTYYFYVSSENILKIIFSGLHYDVITIAFLNFPFIVLYLLPVGIQRHSFYHFAPDFLFILLNALALFISIADIFYFSHAMVRSSGTVLSILDGIFLMLYHYSIEYWYRWLIFLLFLYLLIRICIKTQPDHPEKDTFIIQLLLFITFITFTTFVALTTFEPTSPNISHVVTNTPYVIINSIFNDPMFINRKKLSERTYFSEKELNRQVKLKKYYFDPNKESSTFNILVIVLESFSKDHVGFLNPDQQEEDSYTPFLDSLSGHSLVFTHANGKHSNEGISAIYASIPSFMPESFITSRYNNKIFGVHELVKKHGYHSSFFHGGLNGIYGIDSFVKKAGYEKYFGKDEYGRNEDYDGAWGIWDDKFFMYTAKKLDQLEEPFVSSLYSVS